MLARLDELTATLGTVRAARRCRSQRARAYPAGGRAQVSGDAAQQAASLEPAFSAITAGLARDFAYVDGVGVRSARTARAGATSARQRRDTRLRHARAADRGCRTRW
jgi:hypothetical protein